MRRCAATPSGAPESIRRTPQCRLSVSINHPKAEGVSNYPIIAKLESSIQVESVATTKSEREGQSERRQPFLVASRDEIEQFILENFADSPLGLSVQDIVDRLAEANLDIKRQTLVVRLHRMVAAGKLASRAHGHYILSEAEHGRRRSP
jgi:hypothetical protein